MQRSTSIKQPIRVAYDIARMSSGGANGGIKTHHYEFLRHFSEHHGRELALLVFCKKEIVEELDFLSAGPYNQIHVLEEKGESDYRDLDGSLPPLHFYPCVPEKLLQKLQVDVLYCGFGFSELYIPEVPQISLLVDVLHKDLPEALPSGEVAFRDHWYKETIERSTLIQTNSKFCVESLKKHYSVPEEKLFHIYLPLHGRFNRVQMGELPSCLKGTKYFFYPANHWPHKNHERLLEAYSLYRKEAKDPSLDLALTGNMIGRTEKLKNLCTELDIAPHVHFLGHLDLPDLKAAWELCEALVFPSLYEGFGLPVLEAIYFQKPIICGRVASLPEIVGTHATTMDPESTHSLKDAFRLLAANLDNNNLIPAQHLAQFDLMTEGKRLCRIFQKLKSPAVD